MSLARYNIPIKIFYANMLKIGIKLRATNGALKVGGNRELLTPVLQDEITKRAEHLIEMLTPPPSEGMAHYFGRLLKLEELQQALRTAEALGERVDAWPIDGGWLLTTGKDTQS